MKHVAVVGASGAVGERMIRLLEERRFPVASIKFLASAQSAGKIGQVPRREPSDSKPLAPVRSAGVEIVLSSTPASVSREWSPIAAAAGAVVVDNSSAFRMEPDVPLVVPEVNPHDILKHRGIIANPNCSTIQMVVALKPLHDAARVRRVVVSTYQSVSGAGMKGIHELEAQTEAHVTKRRSPRPVQVRPPDLRQLHPADRRFPAERLHQGRDEDGQRDPQDHGRPHRSTSARPACACRCRSRTASRSWSRPSGRSRPRRPRALWAGAPGVTVVDDPLALAYPLAAAAAGKDDVFVGRIRHDLHRPNTLLVLVRQRQPPQGSGHQRRADRREAARSPARCLGSGGSHLAVTPGSPMTWRRTACVPQ